VLLQVDDDPSMVLVVSLTEMPVGVDDDPSVARREEDDSGVPRERVTCFRVVWRSFLRLGCAFGESIARTGLARMACNLFCSSVQWKPKKRGPLCENRFRNDRQVPGNNFKNASHAALGDFHQVRSEVLPPSL
jgi:hypothetical protein